ncbi:MAG: L-seryl-tRNA(Sec) selenium transferase [Thermoleophilia bacterium]|nr:L-seryl-tRNA(Sec) selenium transferase [Thermoleophilia bacterium]
MRGLPSVEQLLEDPAARDLTGRHARDQVVEALREAVAAARATILSGAEPQTWGEAVRPARLLAVAETLLERWSRPHLRRVINATGVVVHTNLGRSLLADAAVERVLEVARSYNTLEYDLEAGGRGSRQDHVEELLCRLTGADAAMVVNNNAAAVLLILSALAAGREVLVSRGQLVEIGGSFRIPDIMRLSGARLVEVGTTNKTRRSDYETAITSETALLLRVHTSNFKIVGFAEEVAVEELVSLGAAFGLPVADDLGSGALLPLDIFSDEPSVAASLRAGVDVVCFSGDKLLGGPQAGILLGRSETIAGLKRHPLSRAIRVDKMTLAALEGTLQLYRDPEAARRALPTLRYLERTPAETEALAGEVLELLRRRCEEAGVAAGLAVEPTLAKAGGGSLPLLEIPSHAVTVRPETGGVVALEATVRDASPPVIGRVAQDALYLDVLALAESEVAELVESVVWALLRVQSARSQAGDRGPVNA